MEIEEAVEESVGECIEEGILAEFLKKNRAEVVAVSIFEYNEEAHMKSEREFAKEEGREEGRVRVFLNMLDKGFSKEEAQALTELSDEAVARAMANKNDIEAHL